MFIAFQLHLRSPEVRVSAISSPRETLLRLLGPEVSALLADPEVTELYTVEGDRFLWVDSLGSGRRRSSIELPPERAEMLLNSHQFEIQTLFERSIL